MNPNVAFLSHIRQSCETVSQWPSWKTEMWAQPQTPTAVQSQPTSIKVSKPVVKHLLERHK